VAGGSGGEGEPMTSFCRAAMEAHVAEYQRFFGDRLIAVYVWGSGHRGEAVEGVSDLDLHAFVTKRLPEDEAWFQENRGLLEARFPGTAGLSRPLLADVRSGLIPGAAVPAQNYAVALGFRLCFDATILRGEPVIIAPEVMPFIGADFARRGFESVCDLSRFAAGLDTDNKTDFDLPSAPALRLRKLARLAVIGGGWYTVATGQGTSFRGADVLPVLRRDFPGHELFLNQTERQYIAPLPDAEAATLLPSYTDAVARFMQTLSDRFPP
ncbi:MAG: hypothetical protein H7Y38_12495, partial [Armatimonadetes bacterium]|nr:hypothetical protein [Armatimonadota bacterium]